MLPRFAFAYMDMSEAQERLWSPLVKAKRHLDIQHIEDTPLTLLSTRSVSLHC